MIDRVGEWIFNCNFNLSIIFNQARFRLAIFGLLEYLECVFHNNGTIKMAFSGLAKVFFCIQNIESFRRAIEDTITKP